jgi:HD-like signal output (HDOD) protein
MGQFAMAAIWKKGNQAQPVDLADLVRTKLDEQPEIRPFPAAVTQLLHAIQDENATSANFAEIIECDAALALRLLKMANSPLHGLTAEIRSVAHATSLLGTRALKTLAMSAAGATMFSHGTSAAVAREELWRHSLGAGAIARVLAESDPSISSDDAFLACIFHDVGKLFFLDVVPNEYQRLKRTHFGEELTEQERSAFGITHEEIGIKSAHAWNLAENLKVAIGYHHRASEAPVHPEMAEIVHFADNLSRAWGIGSAVEDEAHLPDSVNQRLERDAECLQIVRERAEASFAETQDLCA